MLSNPMFPVRMRTYYNDGYRSCLHGVARDLRITEKRRLAIAAPAISRRTTTRNNVLVLLVLTTARSSPGRGSWDFTAMVATIVGNGSLLTLLQRFETPRDDLH